MLAEKLASGALSAADAASAPARIFNQRLDAALTVFFAVVLWIVIIDMLRICARVVNGKPVLPSSEAPYESNQSVVAVRVETTVVEVRS